MPIMIQCCALALMLILMILYKRQKTIKLVTEKAFMRVFVITIISILFDILSCVVLSFRDAIPELLVNLVCKLYLTTLIGESFCSLFYMCTDLYSDKKLYKKTMLFFKVFAMITSAVILLDPIHIRTDESNQILYTYGPSVLTAYGYALIVFIAIAVKMIKDKKKILPGKRTAVLIWFAVWMVAVVIQFIFPQVLLVSFAGALGTTVLYLVLENPRNNIDRQTGFFNQGAFWQYTRQLYAFKTPFAVIGVIFNTNPFSTTRIDVEKEILSDALGYMALIPNSYVFKNTSTEWLIVLTDVENADKTAKLIHDRFEENWRKNGRMMLRPSWLYVSDPSIATDTDDLLYIIRRAKLDIEDSEKTNFVEVSKGFTAEIRREKETEQLITDALKNDRVEVWYQPIYSTKQGKFTSAEALVRIRDGNGKMIPPGRFIEISERNGSILQIGKMVFQKVCRFISENSLEKYGLKYIEVNLSVVQCAYNKLAEDYISIMEEYGINSAFINLEITESASIHAKNVLLENMQKLMDYGVSFSLDDFGTGQSNLNYIVDMPVEIIKYDKGMTNAYFENDKAKYVMDAVTNMIKGMDLKIVSEGIETGSQYKAMEEMGVNYIQGYYFSKPLPEQEFLEFIERENASDERIKA